MKHMKREKINKEKKEKKTRLGVQKRKRLEKE